MVGKNQNMGQLEEKIKALMDAKDLKNAYDLCGKILIKIPNDKKFMSLKKKIEKSIIKDNDGKIKIKIKELKPLLKQKQYESILIELKPFMQIYQNSDLLDFYRQVASMYEKKKEEENKEYLAKLEMDMSNMLATGQEERLIREIKNLEKENYNDLAVMKIAKKYKTKIIEKKIKEKEELIYSNKYLEIANFLEELKKIDVSSERVFELERDLKKRIDGKQFEEKNEFVFNGKTYIETLINLKKYDKAIKAAEEILQIDPHNKSVLKLLKKADSEFFEQTRKEAIASIEENKHLLKEEYKRNKTEFIKI